MKFAADCYENGKLPQKEMNVLQAIKWGVHAWTYEISQVSIANCWFKSRVIAPKMGPHPRHKDQGELYRSEIRDEAQRIAARDQSQISEEA